MTDKVGKMASDLTAGKSNRRGEDAMKGQIVKCFLYNGDHGTEPCPTIKAGVKCECGSTNAILKMQNKTKTEVTMTIPILRDSLGVKGCDTIIVRPELQCPALNSWTALR